MHYRPPVAFIAVLKLIQHLSEPGGGGLGDVNSSRETWGPGGEEMD
jgi:hypothetical protein